MKRVLFATAFVAGFAGTWAASRYLVPAEAVRTTVEHVLSASTGEPLKLTGRVDVSVFPTLSIRFDGAEIRRADAAADKAVAGKGVAGTGAAGKGATIATMDRLQVSVAIGSLLFGEVVPTRIEMDRPKLAAETGLSAEALTPTRAAIGRLTPLTVVVRDGTLALTDPATRRIETVEGLGATFSWQRATGNASLVARFRWRGEDVAVTAQGLGPRNLLSGASGPAVLNVASGPLELSFNGKALLGDTIQLDGGLSASMADVAKAARWLGTDVATTAALRNVSIEGRLRSVGAAATLADARLSVDGNRAEGVISTRIDLPRPQVRATLAFDTLDTAPYRAALADTSRDLPLGRTLFASLDLDLRASAQSVATAVGSMSGVAATLLVKDGRFDAEIGEGRMFGGDTTLLVRGTANEGGLDATARLQAGDLAADQFGPALGFEALQKGRVALSAEAYAHGRTLGSFVDSLAGRARVDLKAFAVSGAEPLSTFSTLRPVSLRQPTSGRVTDFDRASIELTFERRKAQVRLLDADGGALALRLAGSADFDSGWLDLVGTVIPRGRALGRSGAPGREVPLRIAGSISSPEALPIAPPGDMPAAADLRTDSVPGMAPVIGTPAAVLTR